MPVTVTALKRFPYAGRYVAEGTPIEVQNPVEALVMARKGLVSLTKNYHARDITPDPEPEPEAPRRRRRYRRRDMQAESE